MRGRADKLLLCPETPFPLRAGGAGSGCQGVWWTRRDSGPQRLRLRGFPNTLILRVRHHALPSLTGSLSDRTAWVFRPSCGSCSLQISGGPSYFTPSPGIDKCQDAAVYSILRYSQRPLHRMLGKKGEWLRLLKCLQDPDSVTIIHVVSHNSLSVPGDPTSSSGQQAYARYTNNKNIHKMNRKIS